MQRTTIRLNEHLLIQTKEFAARQQRTVTAVIEDALRAHLAAANQPETKRRRVKLPVSKQAGGLRPGVDLDNRAQLWDLARWP